MRMFAQAPRGRGEEQVLVAVPRGAAAWTRAIRARETHRLLVPVGPSSECENALCYIRARLADRVASVHLVNVQPPFAGGDARPGASTHALAMSRKALGEHVLASVRRSIGTGELRMTTEVAFGSPAEAICALAQPQRFSGIVIGRYDFALDDLIGRSIIAKILQLARVQVTIVNARTAKTRALARNAPAASFSPAGDRQRSVAEAAARLHGESVA